MKKLVRIIIIVVVIGGVAFGAYTRLRPAETSPISALSTATVQSGTLTATTTAAGNIQAHQSADLAFGTSGTVTKINVKVGDRVKTGDILAELDTATLNLQLRSAEVSYKIAQDEYAQTKNPSTEQDIASARAKLESAQAAYDKVAAGASQSDLATAQAQVASAQAAYDASVKEASTSNSSLISAAATLEKARVAVEQAQAAYDKVSWRADVGMSSEAQDLQSATIDYQTAKASYDAAIATAESDTKSQLASAAASLQSAKANLSELQNQVTVSDLASAKATLIDAQNELDTLLAGPDANTLDIAQAQVEQAQISLDQAKLELAQAEIVSPFDGVVTTVDMNLGTSGSDGLISVADLDHLEIEVSMAEVDVNLIKVGQPVEITLDAVSDVTLNGTVSQIAPAGTVSSGVVVYPVMVSLTDSSDLVRTGMTANLNIITEERDNVLLVPNRAVRTVNKQKVATVLFEGQQIQTRVETGLSNDTMTEITNGLKEGDTVVLNATTTSTSSGGMGGMGGMGGPPAGGGIPGM